MSDLLSQRSLTEDEIQECPWDYYRAMHEEGDGFYFDERLQMFICADYHLMREILRDPVTYSSVNSQNVAHMREPPEEVKRIQREQIRPVNILVSADPPEHGRVRKLVDDPFRPREIEKLKTQILDIINTVIDGFHAEGRFDAVTDFAIPIPTTVIADILGLDRSYAQTIKDWSDASVEPLGMMISDERWIECAKIIRSFQEFITAELEARQLEPRDDLLSHLANCRDEHGDPLTLGEMLGVTAQILVAGNETTTNGIAAGVQLLIENPDQERQLRAEPERIYTFVNEVLRLESPVQGLFRIAKRDVELKGVKVPEGARIMMRYAAANRDGKKYANPDAMDICRKNAGTQVGFGAGIHHCLGANLAREEMACSFLTLLERTQNLRFAPEQTDFSHHPSLALRGLKQLQVLFDPI